MTLHEFNALLLDEFPHWDEVFSTTKQGNKRYSISFGPIHDLQTEAQARGGIQFLKEQLPTDVALITFHGFSKQALKQHIDENAPYGADLYYIEVTSSEWPAPEGNESNEIEDLKPLFIRARQVL